MSSSVLGFDFSRLKEYRERAGLTQTQLARRAGIHPITICSYEKGKHTARKSTAERIAQALGDIAGIDPRADADLSPISPADSFKIVCPHCGAASFTFSEIPGVEYKCISCSRSFRVDRRGRSYAPDAPARHKAHNGWYRNDDGMMKRNRKRGAR